MAIIPQPITILRNAPALSAQMNSGYRDPIRAIIGQRNESVEFEAPIVAGKYSTAERDALTALVIGDTIFNTDLLINETWNGTSWVQGGGGSGGTVTVSTSILGAEIVESNTIPVAQKVVGTELDGTTGAGFALDAEADSNLWDSTDLTAMKLTRPIISATGTRETDNLPDGVNGYIVESLVDDAVVDRLLIRRNEYSITTPHVREVYDPDSIVDLTLNWVATGYTLPANNTVLRARLPSRNIDGRQFVEVYSSDILAKTASTAGTQVTAATAVTVFYLVADRTPPRNEFNRVLYFGHTSAGELLIATSHQGDNTTGLDNPIIEELVEKYSEIDFGTSATALGDGSRLHKLQVKYAKIGSTSDQSLKETISFIGSGTTLPANSKVRIIYWDNASSSGVQTITAESGIAGSGIGDVTLSLNTEYVQDLVGTMFEDNTETGISAQYDDANGKINLVVGEAPARTHRVYAFTSGDITLTAAELNAGNNAVGGRITIPTFSGDQYLVFGVRNEDRDITSITSGALNQIGAFTRVTNPSTLQASNGDIVKLWRSSDPVFDDLSNEVWIVQ